MLVESKPSEEGCRQSVRLWDAGVRFVGVSWEGGDGERTGCWIDMPKWGGGELLVVTGSRV